MNHGGNGGPVFVSGGYPKLFFDKDDRKRLWQKAFLVFWSGKALNDILANR